MGLEHTGQITEQRKRGVQEYIIEYILSYKIISECLSRFRINISITEYVVHMLKNVQG